MIHLPFGLLPTHDDQRGSETLRELIAAITQAWPAAQADTTPRRDVASLEAQTGHALDDLITDVTRATLDWVHIHGHAADMRAMDALAARTLMLIACAYSRAASRRHGAQCDPARLAIAAYMMARAPSVTDLCARLCEDMP